MNYLEIPDSCRIVEREVNMLPYDAFVSLCYRSQNCLPEKRNSSDLAYLAIVTAIRIVDAMKSVSDINLEKVIKYILSHQIVATVGDLSSPLTIAMLEQMSIKDITKLVCDVVYSKYAVTSDNILNQQTFDNDTEAVIGSIALVTSVFGIAQSNKDSFCGDDFTQIVGMSAVQLMEDLVDLSPAELDCVLSVEEVSMLYLIGKDIIKDINEVENKNDKEPTDTVQ